MVKRVHVFDYVWILIAISKPCQGTHSYQVQVQSNQPSFILKDFSHSDKCRFRMQMTPDTWMWHWSLQWVIAVGLKSFNIKKALCRMHVGCYRQVGQSAADILSFFFWLHSAFNFKSYLYTYWQLKPAGLTTIWLATHPRSGYFSSVLVNTPALSPVTLLLPIVAVLIAARDESTCRSHAETQIRVGYGNLQADEHILHHASSHMALRQSKNVMHAALCGSQFHIPWIQICSWSKIEVNKY